MEITLKKKYEGVVVTRTCAKLNGSITFHGDHTLPIYYRNYYDLGFDDLFDAVVVPKASGTKPSVAKKKVKK